MKPRIQRRTFVEKVVGSALCGAALPAVIAAESSAPGEAAQARDTRRADGEVRLERLRPRAIEQAMKNRPVLFQPLGTIEWHGRHNIAGLDAVKAHHLCVRAAQRGGGLVAPAWFGGVGGMEEPHTFVSLTQTL